MKITRNNQKEEQKLYGVIYEEPAEITEAQEEQQQNDRRDKKDVKMAMITRTGKQIKERKTQ